MACSFNVQALSIELLILELFTVHVSIRLRCCLIWVQVLIHFVVEGHAFDHVACWLKRVVAASKIGVLD